METLQLNVELYQIFQELLKHYQAHHVPCETCTKLQEKVQSNAC